MHLNQTQQYAFFIWEVSSFGFFSGVFPMFFEFWKKKTGNYINEGGKALGEMLKVNKSLGELSLSG